MILVSGHGVNSPYMAVAANEVIVRTGALCTSARVLTPEPMVKGQESRVKC